MTVGKHIGRNIARLRELKGLKQESLAELVGISQPRMSAIEQSENIEDETLEKLSNALGFSKDAIRYFDGESIINVISNTFNDQSNAISYQFARDEKVIELFEALLKSEKEKNEILLKYIAKLEQGLNQ